MALHGSYTKDIRALDAKFEAQKIAFAPLTFQAVRALRDLKILEALSDAGDKGLSREEAADGAGISVYGAAVLLEMALGLGVVKLAAADTERFVLGKTGWFLLEDELTNVNFNFVNDICYKGAFELGQSVKTGRPRGLDVFGSWSTIYEALSSLPEKPKKSWFDFDHFYSDIAFPEALPIVFGESSTESIKPRRLLDIGGNTAKWAIQCCRRDSAVQVTVVDLPGQTAVAEKNAAAAGFADRISVYPCDILDSASALPQGFDAVWMSQFLDCFALEDVSAILKKIAAVSTEQTRVWVLEPLWDKQRFEAAAFSLQATSLYFTCMANGRSKMYRYEELCRAIEAGGFVPAAERHDLGSNCYSLLCFRLRK
jgi:ubiquinone/menaquinone biosynthesis C-methylase UbiE